MSEGSGVAGKKRIWRVVQILVSIALVVGIFAFAIPKLADYSAVWAAIKDMTWQEIATLVGAMVFNLFTYWWQVAASIPGLSLWQAGVNNQTSTSVANTIPGGGYLAVGVSYAMFRSWGISNAKIALSVGVTGVWNIFLKLGLPVIALALLVATGKSSPALVLAALIGLAVLVAALTMFAMVLWKKELARRIGSGIGAVLSRIRRLFRRAPVRDLGGSAVRFRQQTIDLIAARWIWLTLSTVVSHLALYGVLLLALRDVGVSEHEITWVQVLGVFAFSRLLTALPLTPGGLGFVELSYIGGLILAGRGHADVSAEVFHAQVAAAVLVFRTLTFGIQIPLGGLTYVIWRVKKNWMKPVPADDERVIPQSAPA